MKEAFKAIKVTDNVHWVGAIDWAVRDFHGYLTRRGSTYNAYLIMADKITLIDTVKAPFKDELLARVSALVDLEDIQYIVSNHSEMDHTGCLPDVIEAVKPEKVFASPNGVKALESHFHMGREIIPVEDGGTIDLGNMELTCLETKMLHWPDSMISYLAKDELVFSQDGFGMHLATNERFADEIDESILDFEAAKYYANILLPLSGFVTKLLERVGRLNLPIKIIAPDHGPIWRQDPGWIIGRWAKWAAQEPTKKAVIVYDTMWGSTEKMAKAIGEGLTAGGADVKLMKLRADHRSDVVTELLDAGALIVGSPTINNNIFPTVADLLTYVKGLKPVDLIGAAFGSYGWGGEAVRQVREILEQMNVEIVGDDTRAKYVPDGDALDCCHALGRQVGERLVEICTAEAAAR
ncbi:MAG: flavodoxin domain-containing protein [Planctomycetes bacterium]|nr:flavodoxin domain-containing protein [Planctomycetota bacterium]